MTPHMTGKLKKKASSFFKSHERATKMVINARTTLGKATSSFRVFPDFVIAGAQKAGTTSLYHYLRRHPCIFLPLKQEIHYYDFNYQKGASYYRGHFPTVFFKRFIIKKRGFLRVGECTPYYLVHPRVPERMAAENPAVKIIFLLRNPVMRTYSHFHHECKKNREHFSFNQAIEQEKERLYGEKEKLERRERYYSYNHHRYSYLERSRYVLQIQNWLKFFPKKQMLIIASEDLFARPQEVIDTICDFLDIPKYEMQGVIVYNARKYPPLDKDVREKMNQYFKPYNQALYDLIGVDFGW